MAMASKLMCMGRNGNHNVHWLPVESQFGNTEPQARIAPASMVVRQTMLRITTSGD
jgi:hypothetical protein